jgi:hypothetical protein
MLVASSALLEVGEATVVSGCYLPTHDRGWLYGRPFFVKIGDWLAFVTTVAADEGIAIGEPQLHRLGRPPVHDWERLKAFASAALHQHPKISRSKLADSLVAEYAAKVGEPVPAKRTIERKLKAWSLGMA